MSSNFYHKFRRITTNQLYFPEIDGIRFLAITMVLLFHAHGYFIAKFSGHFTDSPSAYPLLNNLLINGDRGVELFFVLSGFVLCLPFAHHYINNGKQVMLSKYYLRRLTRLEPPYFIAITAIFFMQLAMHINPLKVLVPSWVASMGYMHDLIYHHTPLLTVVAWSLEIEIQFYLLAPLFFSLLALSKTLRRFALVAAILTLIVLQQYYPPSFLNLYGFAQYFLTGILLADFYVSDTAAGFFNNTWMALIAAICLITILYIPLKGEGVTAHELFLSRLALPFLVGLLYYIILKNGIVKRIFSYKFVPIIGGMCYSIYLVHYTVISIAGRLTMNLHFTHYYLPNLLLQIVLLTIPALIISAIFYYYIERPFMSSKWVDALQSQRSKIKSQKLP